jgi:hypothetical protein
MINNNNRRIGLIIFHVICGITYLVCIPLSIYGYYAFASTYSVYKSIYYNYSRNYIWLIVAIILDLIVLVLSIVECALTCCNCCGRNHALQTPGAVLYPSPAVMMFPPTSVTTASPTNVCYIQETPNRNCSEGKIWNIAYNTQFYLIL